MDFVHPPYLQITLPCTNECTNIVPLSNVHSWFIVFLRSTYPEHMFHTSPPYEMFGGTTTRSHPPWDPLISSPQPSSLKAASRSCTSENPRERGGGIALDYFFWFVPLFGTFIRTIISCCLFRFSFFFPVPSSFFILPSLFFIVAYYCYCSYDY